LFLTPAALISLRNRKQHEKLEQEEKNESLNGGNEIEEFNDDPIWAEIRRDSGKFPESPAPDTQEIGLIKSILDEIIDEVSSPEPSILLRRACDHEKEGKL
jgi:hypothetical protein